ncbi:MAG: choice-of-anchor A family protein, partial [Bifidobacteriaceae bacterium]|nr:choice-of-anchor A family protein [Bifidobacteriaceae bacterium]
MVPHRFTFPGRSDEPRLLPGIRPPRRPDEPAGSARPVAAVIAAFLFVVGCLVPVAEAATADTTTSTTTSQTATAASTSAPAASGGASAPASTAASSPAATGSVTLGTAPDGQAGLVTFAGDGASAAQSFTITAAQLDSFGQRAVDFAFTGIPAGATVAVTVTGTPVAFDHGGSTWWNGALLDAADVAAQPVTWTFTDAASVAVTGDVLPGKVVAPAATALA